MKLGKTEALLLLGIVCAAGLQAATAPPRSPKQMEESSSVRSQQGEPSLETRMPDQKELEKRLKEDPVFRRRISTASFLGYLFCGLVLFHFFRFLFLLLLRRRPTEPLGAPAPPTWNGRAIVRLVLWTVLLVLSVVPAERFLVHRMDLRWFDRTVAALINTLLTDAFVIIGAIFLFRRAGPVAAGERTFSKIFFGLRAYLTAVPVFIALLLGVITLLQWLGQQPAPQEIFTLYLKETRTPVLIWLNLLVILVGPAAEEFFFRGLVHRWMRDRLGIARALVLSSLLFACLHTDLVAFVPIFGLGLLFGWIYEKTGSLAAPIAVHVFHNAGMLYLASVLKLIQGTAS